jgi:predicted transcriptional regulator
MKETDKQFIVIMRRLELWEAMYALRKEVTVKELCELLHRTRGQVYCDLKALVADGSIVERKESVWNGMYYAKRCYYMTSD